MASFVSVRPYVLDKAVLKPRSRRAARAAARRRSGASRAPGHRPLFRRSPPCRVPAVHHNGARSTASSRGPAAGCSRERRERSTGSERRVRGTTCSANPAGFPALRGERPCDVLPRRPRERSRRSSSRRTGRADPTRSRRGPERSVRPLSPLQSHRRQRSRNTMVRPFEFRARADAERPTRRSRL